MELSEYAAGNLFVTGELGAGKTMYAVQMIREYLRAGRPVATNLDLFLEHLVNEQSRSVVTRLPDKPTAKHLQALGDAYPMIDEKGREQYDEEKFGLLVLDECLTWLNSRGWQDKERSQVVDWFMHARKHGWNVIFLLQDAEFCDPQLRTTMLTYHVSCRKMGKYKIPILGKLFNMRLPKGTLATVYAGYGSSAIVHDRELYRGADLYQAYKTRQAFKSGMEFLGGEFFDMRASYTMLSAWHIKGRYARPIEEKAKRSPYWIINLFIYYVLRPIVLIILTPLYKRKDSNCIDKTGKFVIQ